MNTAKYTAAELELIAQCNTPEKIHRFLTGLPYDSSGRRLSFRGVARERAANCFCGALFSAGVMEHHGFPPLVIDTIRDDCDGWDHLLYYFKSGGMHYTLAKSSTRELVSRLSGYRTINQLLRTYEPRMRLLDWKVVNLDDVPRCNWRFGESVKALEPYLARHGAKYKRTFVFPDFFADKRARY